MPELPEVETVLRVLEDQLQHFTIKDIQVFYDKIISKGIKYKVKGVIV